MKIIDKHFGKPQESQEGLKRELPRPASQVKDAFSMEERPSWIPKRVPWPMTEADISLITQVMTHFHESQRPIDASGRARIYIANEINQHRDLRRRLEAVSSQTLSEVFNSLDSHDYSLGMVPGNVLNGARQTFKSDGLEKPLPLKRQETVMMYEQGVEHPVAINKEMLQVIKERSTESGRPVFVILPNQHGENKFFRVYFSREVFPAEPNVIFLEKPVKVERKTVQGKVVFEGIPVLGSLMRAGRSVLSGLNKEVVDAWIKLEENPATEQETILLSQLNAANMRLLRAYFGFAPDHPATLKYLPIIVAGKVDNPTKGSPYELDRIIDDQQVLALLEAQKTDLANDLQPDAMRTFLKSLVEIAVRMKSNLVAEAEEEEKKLTQEEIVTEARQVAEKVAQKAFDNFLLQMGHDPAEFNLSDLHFAPESKPTSENEDSSDFSVPEEWTGGRTEMEKERIFEQQLAKQRAEMSDEERQRLFDALLVDQEVN